MPAFFRAVFAAFVDTPTDTIIGQLTTAMGNTGFAELKQQQIKAWEKQVAVLRETCRSLLANVAGSQSWSLLLEYPIPRRQKRIDALILAADLIFCLEFKTKDKTYTRHAQRQAEDYALDLRDFHDQSRGRVIVPVLVAPGAATFSNPIAHSPDCVRPVRLANAGNLAAILQSVFASEPRLGATIDPLAWDNSAYKPVPTIIEAAEALFAGHNVREIAHSHAGAHNLTVTSEKIISLLQRAQRERQKLICFVTGVPGAGKTLAGLNVVHNPALRQEGRPPGVFLSGNGPLVHIVSAAIARDFKRRTRESGGERKIQTFVQNVHTFVRAALDKPDAPPPENVIVFDEAQRAWDAVQTARKTGQEQSEPEILLSIMDRHEWAVIVALVGGGQEINVGEAGLAEWGRSLHKRFSHWRVAAPPQAITGDTSLANSRLFEVGDGENITVEQEPSLHLEVNLRSFRAQKYAEWVDAVLNCDASKAAEVIRSLQDFPLKLTRSLTTARTWLRSQAWGLRRCGLVASAGAVRFRADGLELSSGFRRGNRDLYIHWFLAESTDVRSSNQLEVAASEFECQGLELDWVGVCWGGDFAFDSATGGWAYRSYSGKRWGQVAKAIDRQYLLNTYRVLLTRAREGLVIWVPAGDQEDETRLPSFFDETAEYLTRCGIPSV
jgi:hypothetical protein